MNQENALLALSKTNFSDPYVITKTQSASSVFHRPLNGNSRNSSNSALAVQYSKNSSDFTDNKTSAQFKGSGNFDLNQNKEHVETETNSSYQQMFKTRFGDKTGSSVGVMGPKPFDKALIRRGSSVENINSSIIDLSANGTMKKIKYGNEVGMSLICCQF